MTIGLGAGAFGPAAPPRPSAAASGRIVRLAGFAIGHGQQELLRIGRPLVGRQPALDIRELLRLAAGAVEQPHLRAPRLSAGAAGEEREVAAVGAPARRVLGLRRWTSSAAAGAVPARHPDVGVALVGCRVDGATRYTRPTCRPAKSADRGRHGSACMSSILIGRFDVWANRRGRKSEERKTPLWAVRMENQCNRGRRN